MSPNSFLLNGVFIPRNFALIPVEFNFVSVGPKHSMGDLRGKRESHFQSTSHVLYLREQAICHVIH